MAGRKGLFFIITVLIALVAYTAMFGVTVGTNTIGDVGNTINLGLDIEGGVVVVFEAETELAGTDLDELMTQTIEVISRRVNAMGLTEPNITKQGDKRIRIELPGVSDAQEALAIIGKTAQLEFRLVDDGEYALSGMTTDMFKSSFIVGGESVEKAFTSLDDKGQYGVSLEFDSDGAKAFADGTQEAFVTKNVGTARQIAIVLDGEVISAPIPSTVISDGRAQITGSFTLDEAGLLASLIRGGALPAELNEVQTSVIGPTLGLDALKSSVNAAKIGLALVVLFMIGYYRLPGLVASLALVLYSSIVLLIMVYFNATLTLPGVAGIVLGVGMAVDANVIIFERLKEELKNGKTLRASLDSGFKRALRTIMDANVTTFIAAIVLYNFGEGPIQGFAVTLMIGIITSMFTAIVVTKSMLKSLSDFKGLNNKKFYGA
ncbi:MAG: protein translocase subunit SecD [Clostridia bacterium]|nr:protein translocase subunit SecD [Clostridia bacterium]